MYLDSIGAQTPGLRSNEQPTAGMIRVAEHALVGHLAIAEVGN
jgi:hypothetical protein